ncbi:hypothetical protein AUJ95_08550 [Candidatus Desantisbacteria bacterium CG2_30_40_21]|uniref:Uncharacterized protein n=5 Tax=unclassified Candidatus Desantisiibacteriota TaxID=3106372 RepID=A0A2M7JCK3_9BACT|nr:MAG: hypothetical protein AUJ95_08550 [Candidatus Desantisbacteria bacterium CG2_30_40_21]PIP40935.1 MAG: hypothetical protein COX18_05135 [Candidatus Desantisbacteria bacterium CG23_combo_of_CG06-09_8_20_14_all_40_23]PIX17116.1 MAG: hypothetical protein COZ71_04990 [Candidatus Desantisbacteria bacterium CG_4_8_14_3_um_filter_40_12]PIY18696.1 MAG: hypothetical protein COZ13_09225 [Candidatus Desantisbacteria bacterium CG_4_10_14_3_um_filter_40_18]PJB27907.1 MAG: hypothetical protein CO110_10
MKKTINYSSTAAVDDDLRSEYRFDYCKAKPNRFVKKAVEGQVVVILDEDISRIFRTPESVRSVLRALIATMPTSPQQKMRMKGIAEVRP